MTATATPVATVAAVTAARQHPDLQKRYVRCRNGHILGAIVAGHLNVILRGRELVGDPRWLLSIRCETCGDVWYGPLPAEASA